MLAPVFSCLSPPRNARLCAAFAALFAAAIPSLAHAQPVLGYDLALIDDAISLGVAVPHRPNIAPAAAALGQDVTDVNGDIILPPAPAGGVDEDDDNSNRRWARDYLAIAVGAITAPSYNGSDDRKVLPGFYLRGRLEGFSFSTRGTNLQVDLSRQPRGARTDWKFGPLLNLRSERTGGTGDAQVNALGKRKLAFEMGLSTGVTHTGVITGKYDQIGVRLVGLYDVSGRHKSWVVSPTVEYGTPLSKRAYLGVSASVNLYGKGYGRYYYNIDPLGSAASGLPVYQRAGTKATIGKYQIGMAGAYALSGDLRKGFVLIGGAQYGRITGRYAASPIVAQAGDADQWLAGAGVAYNF